MHGRATDRYKNHLLLYLYKSWSPALWILINVRPNPTNETHAKATTATSTQATKASTIVIVPSALVFSCLDPRESFCPPLLLPPFRGLLSPWKTIEQTPACTNSQNPWGLFFGSPFSSFREGNGSQNLGHFLTTKRLR